MGGNGLPRTGWSAGKESDAGFWQGSSMANGSVVQAPMDRAQSQSQSQLQSLQADEIALPDRWIESLLADNLMNGFDDGIFNTCMP